MSDMLNWKPKTMGIYQPTKSQRHSSAIESAGGWPFGKGGRLGHRSLFFLRVRAAVLPEPGSLLTDLLINRGESAAFVELPAHGIVVRMIEHLPELFLRQVAICIQHLEAFDLTNERLDL